MLLKEGVDNIAAKRGKQSDHKYKARLTRDYSVGRGEILKRELPKRRSISHMHAHTLGELELEETTLTTTAGSTVKAWRTKEKIPKPIMHKDDESGFIAVTGADGQQVHYFMTPERRGFRTSKFKKFNAYFYTNEHLYFYDNIKYVSVRAVFSDLIAIGQIKNKEGNYCVPEIEVPDDLHHAIEKLLEEKREELMEPTVRLDDTQPKENV